MKVEYKIGDRVTIQATYYGAAAGKPDIRGGEIVEFWINKGVKMLVVRVDGYPGRFLRLEEQVALAGR